jgi:predicted AAA+ superfamily ATPase
MIERTLESIIRKKLNKGKAILLMGAKHVGKTTLVKDLFGESKDDMLWLNGDEQDDQILFGNISSTNLRHIFGDKKYVIIDEAQQIENIGLKLKLITDELPDIQLIATCSTSFDFANQLKEPLTGREWEYTMHPLSFSEMVKHHGLPEEKRLVPHRLIYGYYPDVVNNPGNEQEVLKQLLDSFLYKDMLMWEQIKKPEELLFLMQALAFKVGSEVSNSEMGRWCSLNTKTIERYITLLEQNFVIFRVSSFNRNLKDELKNNKKIFFYDNGIRNALIARFSALETRQDTGALWENFLVSERRKRIVYNNGEWRNTWFWRTTNHQKIDYVEESDGKINTFEFKWDPKAKVKEPVIFLENYTGSTFTVVHPMNVEDFLLDPVYLARS